MSDRLEIDPGGSSSPLPLMAAADIQDNLMTASNDLERLQRLLGDASDALLGHFYGASGQLNHLLHTMAQHPEVDVRQLHDATADYTDPEATWRGIPRQPHEVICHNDFAPYNMVFRDHELIGVIDWDFAAPGPRLWDLAYLAYRIAPLMRPENPDAPTISIDLGARLTMLLDAYGSNASVPELLSTIVARLEELASFTRTHGTARKNDKLLADAENYRQDVAYLAGLLR